MLTDQDKARILDEETYRREVRAGLEMADSRGARRKKLWSIVNSAVFIWFLSSIVLGTASFLYSKGEKAYAIEHEKKTTADKLDAEIASRLVYFNRLLATRDQILDDMRTLGEYDDKGTNSVDLSKSVMALERPLTVD